MKYKYSLDDLRYFCIVAQLKSFKNAATHLSIPVSTLSRRIKQLEDDLQLRLLNRDAHRVSLTHTGEQYFKRSSILFNELDDINQALHSEKHQAKGKIRISAPTNAGIYFLRNIFSEFSKKYPEIQLDIRLSNALIDIEAQAIDVVFRVGHTLVDNWIARPLKDIQFVLCVNSSFDTNQIQQPQDLCGKPAILGHPMSVWQLIHQQTGEEFDFHPIQNVRMELDEIQLVIHAVQQNLGIGYIPNYYAQPMIERGELKQILPAWQSKARPLNLLYRDRDNLPLRVRLFIEFAIKHFSDN
ncbi:LysR family transcriptional regulator [Catenovulum sp. 2E275]|uniref:LysR family transcriptional regulator n=1 Tax=Catenovulum sp. 2E275 TaxID=2980497 RepID=UPI0021D35561|nr:LysR family transcriptional regulator [Catenovulum sp. 2E275]MCU4677026.1 LysR family transcriptional regulator [Catenovulum sp. 2E275]